MDPAWQRRVAAWQGLLGVACVAMGIIHLVSPGDEARTFARLLLALSYAAASLVLFTEWARRWAEVVFQLILFATGYWILFISASDVMFPVDVLLFYVLMTLEMLVMPTANARAAFSVMMVGGLAILVALVPPVALSPVAVVGFTMVSSAVIVLNGWLSDRVQQEVRELSLVASRVHNGVALLDPEGRIQWSNIAFVRLSGKTRAQLENRRLVDVLAQPGGSKARVEKIREAIAGGHRVSVELGHPNADGDHTWVVLDLAPVSGPRGRLDGFISVETDISRARAFLAKVLDSMTDMLLVVEEGYGIRSANAAACKMLGLQETELVGMPLEEFLRRPGSGDANSDAKRLLTILARGAMPHPSSEMKDLDLEIVSHSGAQIPVRASVASLSEPDARAQLTVIVARDVRERLRSQTERQRLEKQIREAQKLESLGVLAGGIAHDFNNLLVGILGNASLARQRLDVGHAAHRDIEQVEVGANRAAELAGQMLQYSGRSGFSHRPVRATDLFSGLEDRLRGTLPDNVQFDLSFGNELPVVRGDASQLQQVLLNLLFNATEAMAGRRGKIHIRASRVALTEARLRGMTAAAPLAVPGAYLAIEVQDTGEGMDADTLSRSLEPFFSTRESGRGLGLGVVLGIVRGHKGALLLESAKDEGTTVTVFLPASEPELDRDEVTEGTVGELTFGRRTILIADDEPEVRKFLNSVVDYAGYPVVMGHNGQHAVDLFREYEESIGMVLLDVSMPILDGVEAMRRIRAINRRIPVVLSSGFDRNEALRGLDGGERVEFLQKPYTASKVIELMKRLVGDDPSYSPGSR